MEALGHYLEAVALARAAGDANLEGLGEIAVAALATARDETTLGAAHLARAAALAGDANASASLALEQGALMVRSGDPAAIGLLERALEGFTRLENDRDIGLAHLHLAEAHLRLGRTDAGQSHLERAAVARHAVGSGAFLAAKLRGLPYALDALDALARPAAQPAARARAGEGAGFASILLEDWRALEANGAALVTLTTLGGYGLALEGRPVTLGAGLARTVELLAFLLERPDAPLEQVRTSVFADASPERARNYVQTIRSALKRALPGLRVGYDEARRAYAVRAEGVRLRYDRGLVEAALRDGGEAGLRRALGLYTGPFLPRSESDWAVQSRMDLEFALSSLGLEVVLDLERRGRWRACTELAERLLVVNPLDAAVAIVLVRAMGAWRGRVAARGAFDRVAARFRLEVGDVPEALAAWGRSDPAGAN